MTEKKQAFGKRRVWNKFKKHKLAVGAAGVLILLYLSAVFADFLAPYTLNSEVRYTSYQPPSTIYWFDDDGSFAPHIYNMRYTFDEYFNRVFVEEPSQKYYLRFLNRGERYKFLGLFETDVHLFGVKNGGRFYLCGADEKGRDILSRLFFGGRISIGLVGSFISLILGMLIGAIAGYYGGFVDGFIMRLCEVIIMVPGFYLLLALRAALPPELSSVQIYFGIVFIMSFIAWAGLARIIRGMVLSEARKEYVLGARCIGVKNIIIIIKHILPNTLSYVIVSVTISIPSYILGESALSLLGLGITDPDASWGNMLTKAMAISEIKYHPWILIPGVFIFLAVIMFNLFGDGLRDAFDPKT
ncbi:MAG: ABC transporter permease [Deltaproteobacteria bacterium]|nr:ABC transporter permease [Deltaproteobacteria bacterium]